jgi:hypothetical protein
VKLDASTSPVKCVHVSSSLGSDPGGDGSELHPFKHARQAHEWLLRERGRRAVKFRGGDTFDEGLGSLLGCGEGDDNLLTIEPWGEGAPRFVLKPGQMCFDYALHMHVVVRGMTVRLRPPWYVQLWSRIARERPRRGPSGSAAPAEAGG